MIERFGTLFLVGTLSGLAGCGEAPGGGPAPATPGDVEIEVGECEGNAGYRSASDDTGGVLADPSVWVEAGADGAVVVHLDDMPANCCPSPAATFDTDGADVRLAFVDVSSETSCDCSCVTDFVVTSDPLAAGEYQVAVDYNGEVQGTFPVTIP